MPCLPVSCGDLTTAAMSLCRFLILTIAATLMVARVGLGCNPAMAMPVAVIEQSESCHGDPAPKGAQPVAASQICLMTCGLATPDQPAMLVVSVPEIVSPVPSLARVLPEFTARPSIPPPRLA